MQPQTAKEALFVVRQVHDTLTLAETNQTEKVADQTEIPALGTRDVSHLRMLISIIFKWGTDALLDRAVPNWTTPALPKAQGSASIVDLTRGPEDCKELCHLTYRLLSVVLPSGHRGQLSQSFVANILLTRHLSDVLKPCITLGWLPKALSTPSTPVKNDIRPLTIHFLALLIREYTRRVYGMGFTEMLIPNAYLSRARTTLGYVAATDEDVVVRVMAREAGEGLRQLSNALLGL